MNRNKHIW